MQSTFIQRLVVVLVILAIPVAIAFLNPAIPFGDAGCDSWAWFGLYTFNYERFWDYLPPGTYTIGRLPGMFPGYVIYHVFSPIIASYVFSFLLFWTTLGAWYLAARQFAERWSALLAVVLFAFTPFMTTATANSYIGGVRDAYVAVSFAGALVFFRTQAHWAIWTALVAIIMAMYTHLMTLVYLPPAAVFLLLGLLREKSVNSIWEALGGLLWRGLVALTLVTLAFGVLNELLVGRFLFFVPQFADAFKVWGNYSDNPMTLLDMVARPFMFFVIFVLYDSIRWMREHQWSLRRGLASDYGVVLAVFWAQIAVMFATQALRMRSEQTDEYNVMVVGFTFVVLSFRVLALPARWTWAGFAFILGAVVLGLTFSEPGFHADYMSLMSRWPEGTIHLALLATALAILVTERGVPWAQTGQVIRSAGFAFLCLASISAVTFTQYQPLTRGVEVFQNPREYRAVYNALAAMNAIIPEGVPQVWSDVGVVPEHNHISYLMRHAISVATRQCPLGYFWETAFPKIEAGHVKPGDPLAILVKADTTNALEEAKAALAPLGLRFEFRGQTQLDYTGGPYTLFMGVVRESGA